jgi:O-antigen/teichoic acid export membrane protein
MLPIYTVYISPVDYGKYDFYSTCVTFLASVLFLDIWNGIMRFMFDYSANETKEEVIYNGTCIFLLSCGFFSLVALLMGVFRDIPYLWWIYLYGILMNVQNICSYIVRTLGDNRLYVKAGMISSAAIAVINYIMLKYLAFDYSAIFIASCIGFTINAMILNCRIHYLDIMRKKLYNSIIFNEILKFSLPLCVNSVAYWLITGYNRVVISQKLSFYDNGLYAVATKFTVGITLFTMCFQLAWQEMSYLHASKERSKADLFYSNAINCYITLLGIGACLLVPIVYLVYPILVADAYNESKILVPLAILGTCASALSAFLGNIFGAIKETQYLFITLVISSVINLVLLHTMIPIYATQAVNIALLGAFFVNCLLRAKLLNKYITVNVKCKEAIMLILIFCVVSYLCLYGSTARIIGILCITMAVFLLYYRDIIIQLLLYIKNKGIGERA